MGAPKLTVEQLDARHAEKRAALLARHEEAEKAKAEREAGKAGGRKLELLFNFLIRNDLSMRADSDHGVIGVFWNGEQIGTLEHVEAAQ